MVKRKADDVINTLFRDVDNAVSSLNAKKRRVIDHFQKGAPSTFIPPFESLPWKLLPPGENGVRLLMNHFRKLGNKANWKEHIFDISRLRRIEKNLRPSHCYIGEDGFEGYVAYCFYRTKTVILECPLYGNATYILKDDWKTISKLSKWEARHEHSNQVIVIRHSDSWFDRLSSNLSSLQ